LKYFKKDFLKYLIWSLIFINIFLLTQIFFYWFKLNTLVKSNDIKNNPIYRELNEHELNTYVKLLFPNNFTYKLDQHLPRIYKIIGKNNEHIGFMYDVKKFVGCPLCPDLRYLLAIDPSGNIKGINFIESIEFYGRKLNEERLSSFLNNFINLSIFSEIKFENNDLVTGATKSSKDFIESLNTIREFHMNHGGR